jgi:hypothetical protein
MSGMYGADVSARVTVDQWRSMKSELHVPLSYAIVRCYRSSGSVDRNAAKTIIDAWNAGLEQVDVYHFPNFGPGPGSGHAKAQVDASVDALERAHAKFGRYWIDVEWIGDRKGWGSSAEENVAFLRELVEAAEARGLSVGIYTSPYNWKDITGNDTSFSSYPVWYAHYDGAADFNDFGEFGSFGGWSKPVMKQYAGDRKYELSSGGSVVFDLDWCPEAAPPKRVVAAAEDGSLVAEVSRRLTHDDARALFDAGYKVCVRSLGPVGDRSALTADEADLIHASGLMLMAVQCTEPSSVSKEEGEQDGSAAAAMAMTAGLPAGTNIFCRLSAAPETAAQEAIKYHQAWYEAVSGAGYEPGICVADALLSAEQLYRKLSVKHYWQSARNTPSVFVRGYQVVPSSPATSAIGGVAAYAVRRDKKQGLPVGWAGAPRSKPPVSTGPTCPTGVMTGTQFLETLPSSAGPKREEAILRAIREGQTAPISWREVKSSRGGHTITMWVSDDALRVGTAEDSVRVSVTPRTAQQIADLLRCVLPTTRICDLISEQATVRISPCTYNVNDDERVSTRLMARCHRDVEAKVCGRSGLIDNPGKAWVLTNKLDSDGQRKSFGTYGLFTSAGTFLSGPRRDGPRKLKQPLCVQHYVDYTDYSQVIRLVQRACLVDGMERDLMSVMKDPELSALVSDEGPLKMARVPVPELS